MARVVASPKRSADQVTMGAIPVEKTTSDPTPDRTDERERKRAVLEGDFMLEISEVNLKVPGVLESLKGSRVLVEAYCATQRTQKYRNNC
jgi:hypothetical protein